MFLPLFAELFHKHLSSLIRMSRMSNNTYTAKPVCWNGWISDSYCSLKPLCSGMGEVVPARTSPTLLPPSPRTVLSLSCFKVLQCINCRDWLKTLIVGHGGSSAGLYLADPTSPISSHCASIVVTGTVRVNCRDIWNLQKLVEHSVSCVLDSSIHLNCIACKQTFCTCLRLICNIVISVIWQCYIDLLRLYFCCNQAISFWWHYFSNWKLLLQLLYRITKLQDSHLVAFWQITGCLCDNFSVRNGQTFERSTKGFGICFWM